VNRAARILFTVAGVLAAAGLVVFQPAVRTVEAALAASWMSHVLPGGVSSFKTVFFVHLSSEQVVAFRITAECTSAILIAPLLAFGAVSLLSARVTWVRGIAAIILMIAIITFTNQSRLLLISWMTQDFGLGLGYDLSHRVLGSIIGVIGFVAGAAVMILVTGVRRRGRRGQPPLDR
jgi:exosortase/archaeosortase family protein